MNPGFLFLRYGSQLNFLFLLGMLLIQVLHQLLLSVILNVAYGALKLPIRIKKQTLLFLIVSSLMVNLITNGSEAFATDLTRVRLFSGVSSQVEFKVCFFWELSFAVRAFVKLNLFLMVLFLMELKLFLICKYFFAWDVWAGETALEGMDFLCMSLQMLSKFELTATSWKIANKLSLNKL